MPDPKTNAEGKVYPWAIEQYDYGTYKSLMFYGIQMSDNALMIGKEKHNKITDLYSHMTQTIVTDPETEDTYTADTKVMENVFGANISINRGTPTISVSIGGEDTKGFYLPDQIPKATKDYNEIKGIQQEVSENLRKKYEGKTDSTSRMLDTYAKDYADLIDRKSVV